MNWRILERQSTTEWLLHSPAKNLQPFFKKKKNLRWKADVKVVNILVNQLGYGPEPNPMQLSETRATVWKGQESFMVQSKIPFIEWLKKWLHDSLSENSSPSYWPHPKLWKILISSTATDLLHEQKEYILQDHNFIVSHQNVQYLDFIFDFFLYYCFTLYIYILYQQPYNQFIYCVNLL